LRVEAAAGDELRRAMPLAYESRPFRPAGMASAKTQSQLISLDLWVSGLHASGMKILLMIMVVQSLNLVIFAWFNPCLSG